MATLNVSGRSFQDEVYAVRLSTPRETTHDARCFEAIAGEQCCDASLLADRPFSEAFSAFADEASDFTKLLKLFFE